MTAEFMELRRGSANSSIVITRLTTCGRTLPFIFPRTRPSAIVDRHRLYPIQDGYVRGSSISASSRYDPRASRFEDSANFRRDPRAYIHVPSAIPSIHVVRYFPLRAFFLLALSRGKQRELRCDIIEMRASCFDNITSVSFQA